MHISFSSKILPIKIFFSGEIKQVQYVWKIEPLFEILNSYNLHEAFVKIKQLKLWSQSNNITCKYQAPLLYRLAIYLL